MSPSINQFKGQGNISHQVVLHRHLLEAISNWLGDAYTWTSGLRWTFLWSVWSSFNGRLKTYMLWAKSGICSTYTASRCWYFYLFSLPFSFFCPSFLAPPQQQLPLQWRHNRHHQKCSVQVFFGSCVRKEISYRRNSMETTFLTIMGKRNFN